MPLNPSDAPEPAAAKPAKHWRLASRPYVDESKTTDSRFVTHSKVTCHITFKISNTVSAISMKSPMRNKNFKKYTLGQMAMYRNGTTEALTWAIKTAEANGLLEFAALLSSLREPSQIRDDLPLDTGETLRHLEYERGDTWRVPGDLDEPLDRSDDAPAAP